MSRIVLIAVLGLLGLVAAMPASAAVEVNPSIRGAGLIEDATTGDDLVCDTPSWDDRAAAVPCDQVMVQDLEAKSFRAVPATEPVGHWVFLGWEGCVPATLTDVCTITDVDSGTSVSPIAVFGDDTPPAIGEVFEARSGADGRTVTFDFTADEAAAHGATFSCRLDDGAAEPCTDGTAEYPDVAVGTHTFGVTGTDASGNVGDEWTEEFTIAAPPANPPVKPPVTPPATNPPVVFPTLLFPRVLGPSRVAVKVSRKRVLSLGRVRMRCPAGVGRCPGSVVLEGKIAKRGERIVVARKRYSLRPSTTARVKLRLTRKAARALEARRRLKVTASIAVRAPNVTTRKDVAVTLRAPKPKRKR